MHRKFNLANEHHQSNNNSLLELKKHILASLNELINLNLEDLTIKFEFDQSTSLDSTFYLEVII